MRLLNEIIKKVLKKLLKIFQSEIQVGLLETGGLFLENTIFGKFLFSALFCCFLLVLFLVFAASSSKLLLRFYILPIFGIFSLTTLSRIVCVWWLIYKIKSIQN